MELRVCFVGCGNIASYHLKAFNACRASGIAVRVVAVVDPSAERRDALSAEITAATAAIAATATAPAATAATAAAAQFDSLDAALAADPDGALFNAVDIMVPNIGDLHEALATAALRAGRHTILEKPIAPTVAAARRLLATADEVRSGGSGGGGGGGGGAGGGPLLMVAENAQHWPEVVAAAAAVRAGRLGKRLLFAHANCWESALGEWADDYKAGTWRADAAALPGGSYLFDSLSHWIRPLRMVLASEVTAVCAVLGRSLLHMAGPSTGHALLRFASGATATLEVLLSPTVVGLLATYYDYCFLVLLLTFSLLLYLLQHTRCTRRRAPSSASRATRARW